MPETLTQAQKHSNKGPAPRTSVRRLPGSSVRISSSSKCCSAFQRASYASLMRCLKSCRPTLVDYTHDSGPHIL